MAKKCLERAEDIFIDVIEKKPLSTMAVTDQAPPLPPRNETHSEECKESNGIKQIPTVRLVVALSW